MILATENTHAGNRIANLPKRGERIPEARPLQGFVLSGAEADRTTTMDFIDQMLNKGEQDNFKKSNTDYKQLFDGNDFKLPDYDGIQSNL